MASLTDYDISQGRSDRHENDRVRPDVMQDGIPDFILSLTNYAVPGMLVCPADKSRSPASNWNEVTRNNISYFFRLDPADTADPHSLLAGDSHLTTNGVPLPAGVVLISPGSVLGMNANRHQGAGNMAMVDGSVRQMTGQMLAEIVSNAPPMTLWIP